jgi:hypothetical protein
MHHSNAFLAVAVLVSVAALPAVACIAQEPRGELRDAEQLARSHAKSLSMAFQNSASKGLKSVVTV